MFACQLTMSSSADAAYLQCLNHCKHAALAHIADDIGSRRGPLPISNQPPMCPLLLHLQSTSSTHRTATTETSVLLWLDNVSNWCMCANACVCFATVICATWSSADAAAPNKRVKRDGLRGSCISWVMVVCRCSTTKQVDNGLWVGRSPLEG